MIYLDNAATSFPKPRCVTAAVKEHLKKYAANPGRSSHKLSILASERIYEAREAIAKLLHTNKPENVIFTENATYAINMAVRSSIAPNSHVLISDMEHNSVLRSVNSLSKDRGVEYSVFSTESDLEKSIEEKVTPKTRYIVSTLASNVTGRIIPIEKLAAVAERHSLELIVDASQLIGHKDIDISKYKCNILCAPAHKALFGIQGAGFMVINDDKIRNPLFFGGSGSDSLNLDMPSYLPERYEAGTLPTPSLIALLHGVEFVNKIGVCEIERRILYLTELCRERIKKIKNTVLYESYNGIISFNVLNVPASVIAEELDKHSIAVRSGLHCAPLAHKTIGTLNIGTVRVSFSYLNDSIDIEKFYKALKYIANKY